LIARDRVDECGGGRRRWTRKLQKLESDKKVVADEGATQDLYTGVRGDVCWESRTIQERWGKKASRG
jgi:hypothetical protein